MEASAAGHRLTRLDSGARVITQAMPAVRSVALGVFVGAGSRHEGDSEAGVSHLLEHLLFKGTERHSSEQIDQTFDGMGAEINAGTDKEATVVYSRFLDQHLERAFDVMSDMVLNPAYPEVDSERQVVLEEIAMYEDEPSDKVHDVLAGAIFGDHPLGRPVIGTADVVSSVPVADIAAYHTGRYVPESIVLAAAGNVDHDRLVELLEAAIAGQETGAALPGPRERATGGQSASAAFAPAPAPLAANVRFEVKQTEQCHLCIGGPGIARADERRHALRVLDAILGGSTSSRLFQEVREKRGLAYAIYSYAGHYADCGQVGIYAGTRPDNVGETLGVIADEVARLREHGVSEDELVRARENLKGRTVLAMESTLARMNRLGSSLLLDVPLLSLDDTLAAIDAVSGQDVVALAGELFAPERLSAAGVGADEGAFRAALGALGPTLAAA